MTAERTKTLADIEKIAERGPKAADAALQCMKLAREAEAPEAEAPSNIDELDQLFADFEVGADEADQVIEHLGELDASAEEAVESAIAVAEAYEDQPDEPTARTVAIQAFKARQPKRGAPRPAACKEFGIDPTDPMAVDKVRIAYELAKVGKTLADLEKYHPRFWALPLKTDDGSPSRKLVLSRFFWLIKDEIKDEIRAKEKAVERQKKREAKGYRADYGDLSPKEQKRERDRLAKKWSRERKALKAAGPSA